MVPTRVPKDIEAESIKKHLKDDERKGKIKIEKDLEQPETNQLPQIICDL